MPKVCINAYLRHSRQFCAKFYQLDILRWFLQTFVDNEKSVNSREGCSSRTAMGKRKARRNALQ